MWSGHAMTCLVASYASGGRGRCCRQQHRKSGVCSQASHSRSMCFGQNPHLQILKYGHQDSVLIYLMFPKVNTINSQEQCFLLLLDIRKITYSTQQKRKLDRTSNTWEFPFTCQPVDSNPRWKKIRPVWTPLWSIIPTAAISGTSWNWSKRDLPLTHGILPALHWWRKPTVRNTRKCASVILGMSFYITCKTIYINKDASRTQ